MLSWLKCWKKVGVTTMTATEKYPSKKGSAGSLTGAQMIYQTSTTAHNSDQNICTLTCQPQGVDVMPCDYISATVCVYCGLMQDCPWWNLESGLFASLTKSITPPFLHVLLDAKADPDTNHTSLLMRSNKFRHSLLNRQCMYSGDRIASKRLSDNCFQAGCEQFSLICLWDW